MNAPGLRLLAPVVLLAVPVFAGERPAQGRLAPHRDEAVLVTAPWLEGLATGFAPDAEAEDDGEEGPVAAWDVARVSLAVFQVVAVPPEDPQAAPELEPGLKVAVRVWPFLSFGAEYLATFGPVAQLSPLEEQSHRLFGALDFAWTGARRHFAVNVAVGYDVTGPEQWVGRLLLCLELDPRPAAP
jgi:hypothetical protein